MTAWKHIALRAAFHLLLALFIANAANKFFVPDLDYELEHGFYARIFQGVGDAPDQYRILPLLPLAALTEALPFNHAVLLYNVFFSFLALELLAVILAGLPRKRVQLAQLIFAGVYIYAQYSGWRPDTMGLLCLSALPFLPFWYSKAGRAGPAASGALTLMVVALAFARADVALVLAFFLAVYKTHSWGWRIAWMAIPVGVQILLQVVLFPEATYYSKTVMLGDNLSGYYLVRHPGTYLILAVLLVYGRTLRDFLRRTWTYKWFYLSVLGYLALVVVIGRINEYRLYLPFLPAFYLIWRTSTSDEEADPV